MGNDVKARPRHQTSSADKNLLEVSRSLTTSSMTIRRFVLVPQLTRITRCSSMQKDVSGSGKTSYRYVGV